MNTDRYGNAAHDEAYDDYYSDTYLQKRRVRRPKTVKREKPKSKTEILIGNVDITIYLTVTILVLIGVIMVFSASYTTAANRDVFNHDAFYFLKVNGRWAILGFIVMNIVSRIHFNIFRRFVWPLYIFVVASLIVVIVFGFAAGGAQRWVEIPIIGQFQPSEVAKIAVILSVAHLVAKYPSALKTWPNTFIFSGMVGVIVGLVLIPGGFSTSLIITTIGFGMIFVASPYILRFFVIGGIGVGLVSAYLGYNAYFGTGFRGARFTAWLDPWSDRLGVGFQTIQSLYAVATGGWFGLGIGQSRQASFIPEPQNDFIFAIIVEELGLIGAGLILLLFAIFTWRGIIVAMNATDTFSSMVAIGIVLAIAFQAVINVGVVTNTIPNTGVTLPFISYGGTSLMVSMAMAGILLSISRYSKPENQKTGKPPPRS